MHELIPEYVIDTTVAHELVHYMHGFFSPHQRLYKHPHKGGIVTKELKKRGFDFFAVVAMKICCSIFISDSYIIVLISFIPIPCQNNTKRLHLPLDSGCGEFHPPINAVSNCPDWCGCPVGSHRVSVWILL